MKVLIIGGGGREHALAWKAAQSPRVHRVYVAPGNPGTASEPKVENLTIAADDVAGLVAFARDREIDLTIVGPEIPLMAGVVDAFAKAGLRCFGPRRAAAQLEGSKAHAKAFMTRHGIPTGAYATFTDLAQAQDYIRRQPLPVVVKADGLAAGKGVVIAHSTDAALRAAHDMLATGTFGAAGQRVVIEEFLHGEEASFIVMVDGRYALPLASSQDHKARDDGDIGPNTGGMGAYSPAPVVTAQVHARVMSEVIEPVVRGMGLEGTPYVGFLYAGLMIAADGTIKVLEFNCRFGDPETQPIMMRLRSDIVELCLQALDGRLDQATAEWDTRAAVGVVLAAQGYPDHPRYGDPIAGLSASVPDAKLFQAGTALRDEHVITAGGRVLCACALGDTVTAAQTRAYELASKITWPGMFYRKDIGYRAVAREMGSAVAREIK